MSQQHFESPLSTSYHDQGRFGSFMEQTRKTKTLERNDAEWESLKDEIFRIYMAENNTLDVTMTMIELQHNFTRS